MDRGVFIVSDFSEGDDFYDRGGFYLIKRRF